MSSGTARKQIPKKTRFEIFKRDEFTCQYCGSRPPEVVLQVDHIVPVAGGGTNDLDNLLTSCQSCNLGKGAEPLTSAPVALKVRAEELKEREAQLAEYGKLLRKKKRRDELNAWKVIDVLEESKTVDQYDKQDFRSILGFLERMPFEQVLEAAELAVYLGYKRKGGFRYFCGICWNIIRGRRDA